MMNQHKHKKQAERKRHFKGSEDPYNPTVQVVSKLQTDYVPEQPLVLGSQSFTIVLDQDQELEEIYFIGTSGVQNAYQKSSGDWVVESAQWSKYSPVISN